MTMQEAMDLLVEHGKRSPGDVVTLCEQLDRIGIEGWRDMEATEFTAQLKAEAFEAIRRAKLL